MGRLSRKAFAGWVALGFGWQFWMLCTTWGKAKSLGGRYWLPGHHYLVSELSSKGWRLTVRLNRGLFFFFSVSVIDVVAVLLHSSEWPLTHRSRDLCSGVLRLWAWTLYLARFQSFSKNVKVFLFHSALWHSLRCTLLVHLLWFLLGG